MGLTHGTCPRIIGNEVALLQREKGDGVLLSVAPFVLSIDSRVKSRKIKGLSRIEISCYGLYCKGAAFALRRPLAFFY